MSDSDSDTPDDVHGVVGLPSISAVGLAANGFGEKNGEESKDGTAPASGGAGHEGVKAKAFNKFRDKAKDLLTKTEKPKHLYLSSTKICKLGDDSATSESSSAKPTDLEINDPRFNYDIILSKGYKLLKKMGNGAYASVFLCEKVDNPERMCVIKISIGEERIPDTQNEYEILRNLDLYSIPKVEEIIIDHDYFYSIISMEYSQIDQNVLQYVNSHGSLEEPETKQAMRELLKAIQYIHSLNYAHRDVKPDNVLIKVDPENEEGKTRDVKIILVDYNIAKKAKSYRKKPEELKESSEELRFRCNYLTHIASQNSQAPELFKSGYYSESVDIWGAGLVFYTLMTGEKLRRGDEEIIKEQASDISNLSQTGKELLLQMFSYDGEKRPTATEALAHKWFDE